MLTYKKSAKIGKENTKITLVAEIEIRHVQGEKWVVETTVILPCSANSDNLLDVVAETSIECQGEPLKYYWGSLDKTNRKRTCQDYVITKDIDDVVKTAIEVANVIEKKFAEIISAMSHIEAQTQSSEGRTLAAIEKSGWKRD